MAKTLLQLNRAKASYSFTHSYNSSKQKTKLMIKIHNKSLHHKWNQNKWAKAIKWNKWDKLINIEFIDLYLNLNLIILNLNV